MSNHLRVLNAMSPETPTRPIRGTGEDVAAYLELDEPGQVRLVEDEVALERERTLPRTLSSTSLARCAWLRMKLPWNGRGRCRVP
jgi:hypothetical protein